MSTSSDEVDVLIVGAGASGSIVAKTMAEAGFTVTCLEQGPWVRTEHYASGKPERELLQQTSWHFNPNVRQLPEDYPVEVSDTPVHPVMFNAVGGGTVHYGAFWTRMLPSDFRLQTLDGVGDDWPFDYWELAPYYDKIDQLMGVSVHPGDPAYPPMTEAANPALPIGEAGRTLAGGFNKMGWHWWPGSNAIASRKSRHLDVCKRRGLCVTGCPEGAKASTDIAIWPDALTAGAKLITRARVRAITTDPNGLATGAEWIDRHGVVHHQRAKTVVLACNGLGTSRLMLLSAGGRHQAGLANSSGLVGRRLQMHLLGAVHGEYGEDLQSTIGPYGQYLQSSEFAERDRSRGFWGGARFAIMPVSGPLASWHHTDDLPMHERYGRNIHRIFDSIGKRVDISFSMDDLPNVENRVTIDDKLVDSDGVPAPKVTWRPMPDAEKAHAFFTERLREVHTAAGATNVQATDVGRDFGWHLLGTARMGTNPEDSVVDQNGRAHDVENLFIVDGSVFVTSGQTNPTGTIMALALRTAEHMIATARDQRVSG
ncbi:GMC family oxidoreductase [Mycobacterium sp. CBMA293]|uniref:GMC family oxidoreductase n=1 Tax=unclassified Mycolicibacterium TaxID=2636767 RepID=UPI0012DD3CBC|nr:MULTISPECIES: GMC family oxidoreductase [unclassified Mycolicibacterium]MUL50103.1 GMC family oxidoreductase [Mycolicibacterium sp. CBMA 360]MUL62762.1 GMC family oxidoreductase [Mycolicibacterium sp. CBMA 335]MUL73210.1 GMC family oxidoreductase [Mycolicibacterium sp. CBMA 311]MUL97215.1 GMC family oxidoreductase [Mycolicibacterium sp. CBMA 230]MUM06680.1 glucose dehydrogenase [Mycolicibacterium sp. CBMA 213]